MKSLPIIPSTGIGKLGETTFNCIGNSLPVGVTSEVLMVPDVFTKPSVTPNISVMLLVSI